MSSHLPLRHAPTGERTALQVGGLGLAALCFQTLGVVYSDLGTSPLYTLNGLWPAAGPVPSEADVVGGVSAIIWAITLLPLLKYVFICLRFGTHEGEGGTFALFQGLFPHRTRAEADVDRSLQLRRFSGRSPLYSPRERHPLAPRWRVPLLVWSLFGTALTIADGVFTPAVSITAAVNGIAVAQPSAADNIVPISIAFIVVFFLGQRLGTSKLAIAFAPVTFLWFILIGVTGAVNIAHHPRILRAFDPSRAVMLFVRTKNYDYLAGVLLALTGCEAMFANLGQFNKLSIQLAFCLCVYPAITLAYLGQGARLITDGADVLPNVFFTTIPGARDGALFWIMYVVAILATLVASQTLITATFSLLQQLVSVRAFPPIRVIHTSDNMQGRVYVPFANWILMILCIIVTATFKSSDNLTNAFGFAVATVMFTTTLLIAVQMHYVKGGPALVAVAFFVCFGFLDGLFWGAALKKVPHGAWVALTIGVVLLGIMLLWSWGKALEDDFDGASRRHLRAVITRAPPPQRPASVHSGGAAPLSIYSHARAPSFYASGTDADDEEYEGDSMAVLDYVISLGGADDEGEKEKETAREKGGAERVVGLARMPTSAVFHNMGSGQRVPHSFIGFMRRWPALPRVVVFLSVRVLPVARAAEQDRYLVSKVWAVQGFYSVTYCRGFREEFNVQMHDIVERICAMEGAAGTEQAAHTVAEVRAAGALATHVIPKYEVRSKGIRPGASALGVVRGTLRQLVLEQAYRPLATMFPATGNWRNAADEIIHVGVDARI